MTREQCMAERNHLEWMKNPDWWPNWPICTLKRYKQVRLGGLPETGIVVDCSGPQRFWVFITPAGFASLMEEELRRNLEKAKYTSYEAIVADGWEVD